MSLLLDSGLNLLWLGISVAALVWLAIAEIRVAARLGARLRRTFALVVVALALFPTVSDSDDILTFSLLDGHLGQHRDGFGGPATEDPKEKDGLQLVRLLESLEHYEQAGGYAPAPALFCFQTLITPRLEVFTRIVVSRPGRAPPTA
jgi:hypothetical protein